MTRILQGVLATAAMLGICALCAFIPWPICLILLIIMGAFAYK
jgi:hypothetical protein